LRNQPHGTDSNSILGYNNFQSDILKSTYFYREKDTDDKATGIRYKNVKKKGAI
jgi:hypothetical protein